MKEFLNKYIAKPTKSLITNIRYFFRHLFNSIRFKSMGGLSLYRILKMYMRGLTNGAIASRAESTAYSFFMAVFPSILFIFSLIAYIPIEGIQEELSSLIRETAPPKTWDIISSTIEDIVNIKRGGLLSVSFIGVMIFATNGVYSLIANFRYSFNKVDMRNFISQYLVSLNLLFILMGVLFLTLAILVFSELSWGRIEGTFVGISITFWVFLGERIVIAFAVLLAISLIFYYGPKVKGTSFFSPGAIMSTVLIFVSSYLFGYYINNFAQYNALYGSLGAILIFMFWLFLNSCLLLVGFELNAAIMKSASQIQKGKKNVEDNNTSS